VKEEEEEEEVDQVVVVEVGLVLDVNLVPPTEAPQAAAIAAVAAVQVQALGSTLEERRKPTPILVHPTPNNNLEDPIQVAKVKPTQILSHPTPNNNMEEPTLVSKVKPTQILSHPTPNSNMDPIRVCKANPDNNQEEAVLEAVDLSTPVTKLESLEESTLLVKITSAVVDGSTQEATKDTEPTLDLTSEVVVLIIRTNTVPQITATTMVPQITATTMEAVIVTIIIEATFILDLITTVLDPATAVRIMDTMVAASLTINTGNLEACLAEAEILSPLEPVPAFWAGQWQVWQPCRCTTDTECIPV